METDLFSYSDTALRSLPLAGGGGFFYTSHFDLGQDPLILNAPTH